MTIQHALSHQIAVAILRQCESEDTLLSGRIRAFYTTYHDQENNLRMIFDDLRQKLGQNVEVAHSTTQSCLVKLNGDYRARYPVSQVSRVSTFTVDAISEAGWHQLRPPLLSDVSKAEAGTLARLVPAIIAQVALDNSRRPYSLLTKFLQFLFPGTFPICDGQAAASIQMWSYYAFADRSDEWKRFTWTTLADTTGNGYDAIVEWSKSGSLGPSRQNPVAGEW